MTDPIADMLARIKNGYMARKASVLVPSSKMKESIAQLLLAEGYIQEIDTIQEPPATFLKLTLKYVEGDPVVTHIKRISKPGLRLYTRADKIPRAMSGYGLTLVSTSQGILTDKEARKRGIGGELLCSIW